MVGKVARDALAEEEEMNWVRLLDGRLAWPHMGMAGFTEGGVVIHTEFILPNGARVTQDESLGKKRMVVERPRTGEWWEVQSCKTHDVEGSQNVGGYYWKKQLSDLRMRARMKCGCFGPAFQPGAMVGPTGWQG